MAKPLDEPIRFHQIVKIYNEAGIVVMPLEYGGKKPAVSGAYKDAKESFPINPKLHNVGILLAPSNMVCIDIDDIIGFEALFGSERYKYLRERALIRNTGADNREALFFSIPKGYTPQDFTTWMMPGDMGAFYCAQGKDCCSSRYQVAPPSFLDKYGAHSYLVSNTSFESIDPFDKQGTIDALDAMCALPSDMARKWRTYTRAKLTRSYRTEAGYMQIVSNWLRDECGWDFMIKAVELGYSITPKMELVHPDSSTGSAGLKHYHMEDVWYNHSDGDVTLPAQSNVSLFDVLVRQEWGGDYELAQKEICNGSYSTELAELIDEAQGGTTPPPTEAEESTEIVVDSSEEIKPFGEASVISGTLPDEVIFPKNLRGRLAKYFYSVSPRYNKISAHVAARITLAFLGGKMVAKDGQGRPARSGLFCQLIGNPGTGKEIIQNGIEDFLLLLGETPNSDPTLNALCIENENGSAQGLMDVFMEQQLRPNMLHIEDESGISSAQIGKGNKTAEDMLGFRLKQFSSKSMHDRKKAQGMNKKEPRPPIYEPTLTHVGATTPDNVKRMTSFLVGSGATARVLYYNMEAYREEAITDVDRAMDKSKRLRLSTASLQKLVEDVEDYADQQYFPNTLQMSGPRPPSYYSHRCNSMEVHLTKEAYGRVLRMEAWMLSLPEFEQKVWSRYAELCVKLALVEARCSPNILFKTNRGGAGTSPMKAILDGGGSARGDSSASSGGVATSAITHNMEITDAMLKLAQIEVRTQLEYSTELFKLLVADQESDKLTPQRRYRTIEHVIVTNLMKLNSGHRKTLGGKAQNFGITVSGLLMIEEYRMASKQDKGFIQHLLETSPILGSKDLRKGPKHIGKSGLSGASDNRGRPAKVYYLANMGGNLSHVIRRNNKKRSRFDYVQIHEDGVSTDERPKTQAPMNRDTKQKFRA